MTDLIIVIMTVAQDKQSMEDKVNAILTQVQSYCNMGEYTLTGLHQCQFKKAAQKAANSKLSMSQVWLVQLVVLAILLLDHDCFFGCFHGPPIHVLQALIVSAEVKVLYNLYLQLPHIDS
jgi:hypothetical protein